MPDTKRLATIGAVLLVGIALGIVLKPVLKPCGCADHE